MGQKPTMLLPEYLLAGREVLGANSTVRF